MPDTTIRFTPKQLQILEFIIKYTEDNGLSPTLEEIATGALNKPVTKITVYEHVNQLEAKGAVKREKFRARSITVLIQPPGPAEAAKARLEAFVTTIEDAGYTVQRTADAISIQRSAGGFVVFTFDEEGKLANLST